MDFHFLSSYSFSAPTSQSPLWTWRLFSTGLRERIPTGRPQALSQDPGQRLTPDGRSAQTHAQPGHMLTPDRLSPRTDAHPRQTLTPDTASPQSDPHPSCSKSRHHGDRAPPADSSRWWPGQEGLWAESPSPKSSFCVIRFCPLVHCSQMSTASSGRS